jgi:uncharacterized protein (TIGR03067 family)
MLLFLALGCPLFAVEPLTPDDAAAKDKAIQQDRKTYTGTWQVVSLEVNGNKSSDEDARKITVENQADGTWIIKVDDKEVSRGTSTIDPTKKPKTIDFVPATGDSQGRTHLGIYELTEKTRKLCFAEPDKERPTEFSAQAGTGHVLVTFERQKDK